MSTFNAGNSNDGIQGNINEIENVTYNNSLVVLSSDLQFVKESRPVNTVSIATWNTFQYTPLLFVDSKKNIVLLTNLSGALTFLVGYGIVRDYLKINIHDKLTKRLIETGHGKDLIRYAMNRSNSEFTKSFKNVVYNMCIDEDVENNLDINKADLGRLTEWFNHIVASCSLWKFPVEKGQNNFSPAWNVSTCTPDIPIKSTNTIKVPGNMSWVNHLKGEYIVITSDTIKGHPQEVPNGALAISNHVLSLIYPSAALYKEQKLLLSCFGGIATSINTESEDFWLFKFESNIKASSQPTEIKITDKYMDYWFI